MNATGAQVRKFGLTLLAVCGSFLALAIWRERRGSQIFFGVMSGFGALFALFPLGMAPVHELWHRIGNAFGRVVIYVAMTIIYFLVITPYALIMKAFGRQPIPTGLDRGTQTYWVHREEPIQSRERMTKRF